MAFVSAFFRLLIGAVFGFGCFIVLSPALAALLGSVPNASALVLAALVLVGALVGFFSRSIRRAFGWSFLALALSVVALPLSTMLLAGRVAVDASNAAEASERSATVVGAGIAGTLLTGGAAIIGFFLGAIFLVIALILLLGGRRQVILVDRATGREVEADSYAEPAIPRGRTAPRIDPPLR
jgi:hypothetical protein